MGFDIKIVLKVPPENVLQLVSWERQKNVIYRRDHYEVIDLFMEDCRRQKYQVSVVTQGNFAEGVLAAIKRCKSMPFPASNQQPLVPTEAMILRELLAILHLVVCPHCSGDGRTSRRSIRRSSRPTTYCSSAKRFARSS